MCSTAVRPPWLLLPPRCPSREAYQHCSVVAEQQEEAACSAFPVVHCCSW